jgi:hypothetical protein
MAIVLVMLRIVEHEGAVDAGKMFGQIRLLIFTGRKKSNE